MFVSQLECWHCVDQHFNMGQARLSTALIESDGFTHRSLCYTLQVTRANMFIGKTF